MIGLSIHDVGGIEGPGGYGWRHGI